MKSLRDFKSGSHRHETKEITYCSFPSFLFTFSFLFSSPILSMAAVEATKVVDSSAKKVLEKKPISYQTLLLGAGKSFLVT